MPLEIWLEPAPHWPVYLTLPMEKASLLSRGLKVASSPATALHVGQPCGAVDPALLLQEV